LGARTKNNVKELPQQNRDTKLKKKMREEKKTKGAGGERLEV